MVGRGKDALLERGLIIGRRWSRGCLFFSVLRRLVRSTRLVVKLVLGAINWRRCMMSVWVVVGHDGSISWEEGGEKKERSGKAAAKSPTTVRAPDFGTNEVSRTCDQSDRSIHGMSDMVVRYLVGSPPLSLSSSHHRRCSSYLLILLPPPSSSSFVHHPSSLLHNFFAFQLRFRSRAASPVVVDLLLVC